MVVLQRFDVNISQGTNWIEYHEAMTEKHDFFVRFKDSKKPYYADGELKDILSEEVGGYYEVLNCNWKKSNWSETPYLWRIIPELDIITELFASELTPKPNFDAGINLVGYRRNGEWLMKSFNRNNIFYRREKKDRGFIMGHVGSTLFSFGSNGWKVGNTAGMDRVDSPPRDILRKVAKEMKSQKYKNFYEDEVKKLADIGGFSFSLL